jgi:hypothetical protein
MMTDTITNPTSGRLSAPAMDPAGSLARDFRASIMAPFAKVRDEARAAVVRPEVREWVMGMTGGDPAQLDALFPPAMLRDVLVEIIRGGVAVAPDPVVLIATPNARAVGALMRHRYEARIEYTPASGHLRIVVGWHPCVMRVAYARARPDGRLEPEPDTIGRLQAAVDLFAAVAAEVTR